MLETEAVDRPTRYFAIHFYLLRFLGLGWWHHPDEDDNNNFPGLYIYYTIITEIIWVAGFVGLESIDPFIGDKDIDRFMFSLSFVITHDLTIIKLYIFLFKNRAIQDIVRTLEIDIYKFYQNNNRNRATIRSTKIMTGSFLFFGWITIGNTNVYGTIQDNRWRAEVAQLNDTSLRPPRTLPQPIYIPWKYQTDASYISTFILETVGLLWTGHIVMTIDTFIGCVEKFRVNYSYGFMTQLLSSMAAICVVMVQVSQDASSFKSIRLVTSLAFFVAMIIQLAIQCFTGNELTLQTERVSNAVMQSKWERMTPRVRRYLLMAMLRAQRPLRLTAAGFAYMDNGCFLAIMKAAYSYYAVLSQKEV
ncbi:uncharacterized protein isoform X2 [Choristoneura fumiferana]|uniref:uncharacterized protein isoform X2 n=1 Tax=Choristoneura fumiferana TaxID=7141 RepID=UPI003D15B376